jgi:hypothetical protein
MLLHIHKLLPIAQYVSSYQLKFWPNVMSSLTTSSETNRIRSISFRGIVHGLLGRRIDQGMSWEGKNS